MKVLTPVDPIILLQSTIGEEWAAMNHARAEAITTGKKLDRTLKGLSSSDAAIVVFGSLARKEWTSKSDVDWTLLIDGQADPQHLEVALKVAERLRGAGFPEPGTTGIFGNMTFSHDLVQKIGGREDTNENTTRRVLLLQESEPFGKPDAHERVLRLIVRYWRTVTVDFVEKQRGQAGHGWGLRNAKLRMSRKLIFATGMLTCFSCEMLCNAEARRQLVEHNSTIAMEEHLRAFIKKTPLEILATFLVELKIKRKTAVKLFSAYNSFLKLLDDGKKRDHLKKLRPDDIRGDAVFKEVRGYSHDFQDGLTALFFNDHKKLRDLTIFYGVF